MNEVKITPASWVKYPETVPEETGWYRVVVEENTTFGGCKYRDPQILFFIKDFGFKYPSIHGPVNNVVAFVPDVIRKFDPPSSEFFENDFRLERIETVLGLIRQYIQTAEKRAMDINSSLCETTYTFPRGTTNKEISKILEIVDEYLGDCMIYSSFKDDDKTFNIEWERKL